MTKFFEVISISATHIYHSALELSPLLSTVRKLYHHRYLDAFPNVLVGIPHSWDSSVAISNTYHTSRPSAAWSPCGQFVAIRTGKSVEIRDALTFGRLFTLQPVGPTSQLTGAPAYSPDGRSLACAFDTTITIWDIQTGGDAQSIQRSETADVSPVWSLNGNMIGTIVWEGATCDLTVRRYNVASGEAFHPVVLKSQVGSHLWAHGKSFRVMVTKQRDNVRVVDIPEAGSTPTEAASFTPWSEEHDYRIEAFSPTTDHISISINRDNGWLRIFDVRNARSLLDRNGGFTAHCFSRDGELFSVLETPRRSTTKHVRIWRYDGKNYTEWKGLPSPDSSSLCLLLFSPTSSSILGQSTDAYRLWRLDGPSSDPTRNSKRLTFLSRSVAYMATAHKGERTIEITNLLSRTTSRSAKMDMSVEKLALTGNVLLVVGLEKVSIWRLTEEGEVDGGSPNGILGRKNRIWKMPLPSPAGDPELIVEGQTGFIGGRGLTPSIIYDIRTGEVLKRAPAPLRSPRLETWNYLQDDRLYDNPSGEVWERSTAILEGEWVKGSGGERKFWLPVEWRVNARGGIDWCPDIAAVRFLSPEGRPVIIKLDKVFPSPST